MLMSYKRGQTSVVLRVKILDSSVTTGAGLTGLTSASSGLRISTIADNESTATAYTVAGSTIETITTLGTYAAPTATKCRFKEVDSTNHKGVYEIQIADARFAVSSAKSLIVSISGATNAAETDVVIPLQDLDPYTAAEAAVWNAARASYVTSGTFGQGAASVQGNVTGNVTGSVNSVTSGVNLASTGLDSISTTVPSTVASTFRDMMVLCYRRFYGKTVKAVSGATVKTYAVDGSTVVTTQTYTDDGAGNETLNAAS